MLAAGNFKLATECLTRAKDHSALLLLYSCQGDRSGMEALAKEASEAGRTNVAFVCNYLLGHTSECLNLLVEVSFSLSIHRYMYNIYIHEHVCIDKYIDVYMCI